MTKRTTSQTLLMVVLAALAIASLSGCDAILETVYPAFGDTVSDDGTTTGPSFQMGSHEIEAYLSVAEAAQNADAEVRLALVPIRQEPDGWSPDFAGVWLQSFWRPTEIEAYFGPLPSAQFRLFAWHDANNDEMLQPEEPATSMYWFDDSGQQRKVFDFTRFDDPTVLVAEGWLDEGSRLDYDVLQQLVASYGDAGDPTDIGADLGFSIEGPRLVLSVGDALPVEWFTAVPNAPDPDVRVVSHVEWELLWDDELRSPVIGVDDAPLSGSNETYSDGVGTRSAREFEVPFNEILPPIPETGWFVLRAEVVYVNPNDHAEEVGRVREEAYLQLTAEDLGFEVNGPWNVWIEDPASPPDPQYDVVPNDGMRTVSSVWWNLIRDTGDVVGFTMPDGSVGWDWMETSPAGSTAIVVPLSGADVPLTDPWWTEGEFILQVEVQYDDGGFWYQERFIRFEVNDPDSDPGTTGAEYTITFDVDVTGQSWFNPGDDMEMSVYVYDNTDWTDLVQATYLVTQSTFQVTMPAVYDPPGLDQWIDIYFDNWDTGDYAWASYEVLGDRSGPVTVTVSGTPSADAPIGSSPE